MLTKTFFTSFFLILIVGVLSGQQPCAIDALTKKWIEEKPERALELLEFELERGILSEQAAAQRSALIIPVVVHVIHEGEAVGNGTNVSLSRISSQLEILNDDFKRSNADAGQTPNEFLGVAGNAGITFCLASVDPSGSSTTGITRQAYNNIPDVQWIENNIKPATIWDSDRYLNIWVVDIPDPTYLGYSYLPTATMVGSSRDGLVVDFNRFGYISSSNRGRTVTHELGHYLGLSHIWGSNDGSGNPIGCSSDDGIGDTPDSDAPYFDCPSSGSSCGSSDMFMNYMDYTDDYCMNLFTQGQATLMQNTLNGIRSELISGNLSGCTSDCTNLASSDIDHGFEANQANSDWTILNANSDNRTWSFVNDEEVDWGPNQGSGMAVYFWNTSAAADDYLFSPCMEIQKNHEYRIRFSYACAKDENSLYPEKFEVGFSRLQSSSDFNVPNNDWIFNPVTNAFPDYKEASLTFTASDDDNFSVGFHIFSDADQYALQLDDIRIEEIGILAIDDPSANRELKAQPNPTSDFLFVEIPVATQGPSELSIYGLNGQLLQSWQPGNGSQSMEISLESLPAGVFLLKWTDKSNQWTQKVVKVEGR